jgi:hypothetical protein
MEVWWYRAMLVVVLVTTGGANAQESPLTSSPAAELVAHLRLPNSDPRGAFRAVALNLPWVYALERSGSLVIFRLRERANEADPSVVRVLKDAGDGHALQVFGDVLVCTRHGHLDVYSLNDPANPRFLRRAGPNSKVLYDSHSIVRHANAVFVLGRDGILSYDVSVPARPRLLAVHDMLDGGWVGCMVNDILCVGDRKHLGKVGIAIFDVSNPSQIREIGFAPAQRTIYGAAAISHNQVIVSMDPNPFVSTESLVHGAAALYDVTKPDQPVVVESFRDIGGRTTLTVPQRGGALVFSIGAIHHFTHRNIEARLIFDRPGTNRDGFPYHSDTAQGYVALTTDQEIAILKLRDP